MLFHRFIRFLPLFFLPVIPASAQNSCVDISLSANEVNIQQSITFQSKSTLACDECEKGFAAKAYQWKFEGGEPSTAFGPGPHTVKYSTFGNFDVELEVSYIHPNDIEKECKQALIKKDLVAVISKENVVLKDFIVKAGNKSIVLNWTTLYERDNEFFIVEKSANDSDYTEIATVRSEGNKLTPSDYLTDDKNPVKGLAYYRLKIKLLDGSSKYSGTVAVKWIDINELLNIGQGDKVLVIIHDKDGNELYSKVVIKGMENGAIVAIDPMQKIEPGTYTIVGSSNNEMFNKQLVVQQAE